MCTRESRTRHQQRPSGHLSQNVTPRSCHRDSKHCKHSSQSKAPHDWTCSSKNGWIQLEQSQLPWLCAPSSVNTLKHAPWPETKIRTPDPWIKFKLCYKPQRPSYTVDSRQDSQWCQSFVLKIPRNGIGMNKGMWTKPQYNTDAGLFSRTLVHCPVSSFSHQESLVLQYWTLLPARRSRAYEPKMDGQWQYRTCQACPGKHHWHSTPQAYSANFARRGYNPAKKTLLS